MATVYTVTIDTYGLDEEEILAEAKREAAEFFDVPAEKVTAEILSVDIGGEAVVQVDKSSGTLLG